MASRETRDTYRGKAIIMNVNVVGAEDWKEWERKNLPEADKSNAFQIEYDVAEGNPQGARHTVSVECSHRELSGKMLEYYRHEDGTMPTQMDVTIRTLVRQGILARGATERDIGIAMDDALCGREVTIRAYEELGNDGEKWWPRCAFASAKNYISGADKAARLAAFLAGKPAPKPTETAKAAITAAATASMPAAPAEDDENVPF